MKPITIHWPAPVVRANVQLPASKSESNRCLIIQELAGTGAVVLDNLSQARDTRLLLGLIDQLRQTPVHEALALYARDAGTTLRFVTALCAALGREATISGTERMMQRPVGPLTDALQSLGTTIQHLDKEGYPPVKTGVQPMQGGRVQVRGDISSQFITALLLVGPCLPKGIEIEVVGELHSRPYVEMTLSLMRHFGAQIEEENATFRVLPTGYRPQRYAIEADWSAASYWYAVAALSQEADLLLPGLRNPSLQGDSAIATLMEVVGVQTLSTSEGVRLLASANRTIDRSPRSIDFSHIPDLAQTVAVVAAAQQLPWTFTGLQSLRIKETDRIVALQQELAAFGSGLHEGESGHFRVLPIVRPPAVAHLRTYDDHRMAMAFAPLALLGSQLVLDNGAVVEKSYPDFWTQLALAGAKVSES